MVSLMSFYFLLCLWIQSVLSQNTSMKGQQKANFPPRGWNSYDSFSWTISEQEFFESAQIISQRLLNHGYEYAVVDYLWYRNRKGSSDSLGFDSIDEWGRMLPDEERWPSSKGGKGFREVSDKVHKMGLKFGIHLMGGISTQAVNANTPIFDISKGRAYKKFGRVWHAKDIGIPERACKWMPHGFMSVNMTLGAGKAFLKSLYHLYASWGVDFVKLDCVFGEDLDIKEIRYVSKVLRKLNHHIVFSLSPGTSVTVNMAKTVNKRVNMYRITGDDWDKWDDLAAHFDVIRNFSATNMIGVKGAMGNSWPDMDMLPFGWLTDPGVNQGPHRYSNLTLDEKKTQLTLWSMAKSPLMYGGDVRKLDQTTYDLITNPTILEINHFSSKNTEYPYITSMKTFTIGDHNLTSKMQVKNYAGSSRSWVAMGRKGKIYVAFFNLNAEKTQIFTKISDLSRVLPVKSLESCNCREVWRGKEMTIMQGMLTATVDSHGCALFVLICKKH